MTLRNPQEMSWVSLKVSDLHKVTCNSSETGLEGAGTFASENRALSTMVLCKSKKPAVWQPLKSDSESNSTSDKAFVDKGLKSNGRILLLKVPGAFQSSRGLWGRIRLAQFYSLVQKIPDNEVAGAVWDGDNDKLATKMRIKQIYCLKT